MTTQNGRAFNEWLRAQLKAKKMSQRQLAQQSGVDHSTISRLIRGDRMPSLGTATKLARGLRELRDDADTPQYLGLVASGATNPTARVEYALRADELLSEPQVRQIMEYYLAVRMRRFGRAFQPSEPSSSRPPERPIARSATVGGARWSPESAPVATSRMAPGQSPDGPLARPARPTLGPGRPDSGRRPPAAPSSLPGHDPDALHVRVSGTANAGVWGAGVRIFAAAARRSRRCALRCSLTGIASPLAPVARRA